MTPSEFVLFEGDSAPNTPIYKVAEALQKCVLIYCDGGEAVVRSYYYCEERKSMVLELMSVDGSNE